MPSERPKMPTETYEALLRRHHAPGLSLQAGEVAVMSYRRKNQTLRNMLLLTAGVIALCVLAAMGRQA